MERKRGAGIEKVMRSCLTLHRESDHSSLKLVPYRIIQTATIKTHKARDLTDRTLRGGDVIEQSAQRLGLCE